MAKVQSQDAENSDPPNDDRDSAILHELRGLRKEHAEPVAVAVADNKRALARLECRYVTELFGGETYVSCSVVLPALCHLCRTMEVSDKNLAYIGKFKTAFKKDLFSIRPTLQGLEKGDGEAVWTSLQALLENKPSTATPEPVEKPPEKRSLLLFASDTDSDDDMVEPSRALNHYKAEPTISMEEFCLQWWKTHAGAINSCLSWLPLQDLFLLRDFFHLQ
ncbi:unnamed protein product, partial [Menidia menidia]